MPTTTSQQPLFDGIVHAGRRMPFVLLFCAALFANFTFVGGHDRQRVLELGVFLAGGILVLARCQATLHAQFAGRAGKMLAAFFALGLASAIGAYSQPYALYEVAAFFMLYLLALGAARDIAANVTEALPLVLHLLGAACAVYGLVFAVTYGSALSLGNPLAFDDFTFGFSNIRFFNHVQTATLPLLILWCCLAPAVPRLCWFPPAVTGYWWMALFATNGRGTMLGVAVACVVVAGLLRRTALRYLRMLALTAMLGLLAYFVLLVAVPALAGIEGMSSLSYAAGRTAADPASGRMLLWRRAAELIGQHPLLGVGPMHFAHHAGDLRIGAHPHDWVFQIGSEWGLPALGCLGGPLALGLHALLRAARQIPAADRQNQAILAALLMGAVAILADGLVSGLFVMPASRLAIALYLGCAMGWYRAVVPQAAPGARQRSGRAAGIVLVFVALACLAAVWPEALARYRGDPLTPERGAANLGTQWPRLWQAGYF